MCSFYTCVHLLICVHTCTSTCVQMFTCVHMFICVRVHVFVHLDSFVHMCSYFVHIIHYVLTFVHTGSFVHMGRFSWFPDGQLLTTLIATPNFYNRTAANPYAGSKLTHPSSALNHSSDVVTSPTYNALGAVQFQVARPLTLFGPVTVAPAYQPVFYWYPGGMPMSLQGSYYTFPSTVAMKGLPVTAQPGDVIHFLEGVFEVRVF